MKTAKWYTLTKIFTIVKYIFAVLLTLLTYSTTKEARYVIVGLVELALIFLIYNTIVERHIVLRIIGGLLYFIYVAQMVVLYFGNSFITLTMLKNIKFLEDLGGKLVVYLLGVALGLVIVFLPGQNILKNFNKKIIAFIIVLLVAADIGVYASYKHYSPTESFATIFIDEIRFQQVKKAQADPNVALQTYYNESLGDAIAKPADLPDNPNIILIFTEGLSYNIISDERNIMPNLKEFEGSCISFKSYYNHTFPTLRGVQGQLYSGYKLDDNELGNNLISLQDILKSEGYSTHFINTEPYNEEFVRYLNNLDFDEIATDTSHTAGYNDSLTDAKAYDFLYEYAKILDENDEPFLLGIYTFGTHVSFDSTGGRYGNGDNAELNKFYNLDTCFGTFFDAFENSDLADDTIIIFTADHCTYADQDYTNTFSDYKRACTDVDTMPFFIYYKGISPKEIEVDGRNSLCLAPTILDYLDIDSENYFLGSSLFDSDGSTEYDTVFYDASYLVSTKDGDIRYLNDLETEEFLSKVLAYYSALEAKR